MSSTEQKDPRISTTRIICVRPRPKVPHFVAWPAMSSLLFLFSALCLLFGAWTVFASLADEQLQLVERFAMVGAVHGYELALFCVAVLLCRFQKYNPDAIGPLFLGASFCIGSAVTLDLVSIDAPWLTLMCGLSGIIFTVAKGRALAWINKEQIDWTWVIPVAALVLINLLWPGIMGIQRHYAESGLYTQWWWMPAWASILACAIFIVIGIIRANDLSSDRMHPFLRRCALRWTVALVLIACSLLHLLVLGYLHNLDVTTGEFLPHLAVLAIGLVDLRHRALGTARLLDATVLSLPLVFGICAVVGDDTGILSNPRGEGSLFNPAIVMGLYALGLFTLWYRQSRNDLLPFTLFAASLTVLVWQVEPTVADFNWTTTAAVISGALCLFALYHRASTLIATTIALLGATAFTQHDASAWLSAHAISPVLLWTAICGSIIAALMAWRPQDFSRWAIRITLAIITMSLVILCTRTTSELHAPAIAAVLIAVTHGLLVWRTQDYLSLAPVIILTILFGPSALPTHKGWIAVIAAFALLAIGTGVSYMRVRRQHSNRPSKPTLSPTPITVSALEPISV